MYEDKTIEERMKELKIKLNPPEPPIEDKVKEIKERVAEKLKKELYSEDAENKLVEDLVNHPEHYKAKNGVEAITLIAAFTEDLKGMEAVCTANALKYLCRWHKKNGLEDLKKAQWYLNYLIDMKEKERSRVSESEPASTERR